MGCLTCSLLAILSRASPGESSSVEPRIRNLSTSSNIEGLGLVRGGSTEEGGDSQRPRDPVDFCPDPTERSESGSIKTDLLFYFQ